MQKKIIKIFVYLANLHLSEFNSMPIKARASQFQIIVVTKTLESFKSRDRSAFYV